MKTKSGLEVKKVGIGTWNISSDFDPILNDFITIDGNEEQEIESIIYALSKGLNHIDTAEIYGKGKSEKIVAKSLQNTKISRDDIYITSKLWKTSIEKGKTRKAIEEILTRLNTDYLDSILFHNSFGESKWIDVCDELEKLKDEKIIRYIGASNFNLLEMKESPIQLSFLQNRYSLIHKDEFDEELIIYCDENNIIRSAYQTLVAQFVENQEIIVEKVFENPQIIKKAKELNIDPAVYCNKKVLEEGFWITPKSTNKEHIDKFIDLL